MKKRMMKPKIFSFALALFIAFGAAKLSVYAEPTENAGQGNAGADLGAITYSIDSDQIDVSDVTPYSGVTADEDVEVDTDNPEIAALADALEETEVQDEEGEAVALTEEQINQVLDWYTKYQDQWKANANLLGVQQPFFLSYNDGEDGLGALGEMLVLAGYSVDDVRNGKYKYDDLIGMIQNFYFADKYAIEYYSDAINTSRNEALEKVEKSGAKTLPQKMLVINDWLAHKTNFDMAYIMKDDDGNPIMTAEDPRKHEHYVEIYDEMYRLYEDQIRQQFHDQIYDGVVAQLRQQYYEGAIKNIVMEGYKSQIRQNKIAEFIEKGRNEKEAEANADAYMEQNAETIDSEASTYAEQYMTDNADAISKDAAGFVEENFGKEAAAQISAGADEFIEEAKTEGVEVDPEKAPGVKMTIEDITQNTMKNELILDLDGDGENETTANDAIPIYAEQAATGLTEGIIGAWEGNHVGPLAEGIGVCAGYSKAFSYLLQYMSPEIYGVDGAGTDMSVSENWKTPEDLYYTDNNLDITKDYLVDMVRITFAADVSMFGEASNFGEVHFWNAVNLRDEEGTNHWYYVDPCYTDIYVECMSRDRVEIDGTMNHMYFMFSHTTANEMYDGNMPDGGGIASLYSEVATDTSYEDSWFARIASNTYISDDKAYYMYDSTDQLSMMREFQKIQNPQGDETDSSDLDETDFEALMEGADPEYKLVYHTISNDDLVEGGADQDFTTLIEFNPKDDDDNTLSARVYNPSNKEMEENEPITELFAQYKDECDIYPSIKMTTALHNGKLYFNLSNCILSYDIASGAVEKVKEYNTVYAACDKTVAFRGMAFSVCDKDDPDRDLSVTNHPIAALTIKDDGQMYVSVATNYAFISGKDAVNDTKNYGYSYEESNYNPDYSTYMQDSDYSDSELESMGYSKETNDNDEFMWSAVFVDKMDMTSSCEHTYASVTVEPTCGRDGYTENRCTKCGAPEADSRDVDEGSALTEHHYVHFDETYYTYTGDGEDKVWNTGECYVCTICGFAIEKPTEPREDATDEEIENYKKEKEIWDNAVKTAGHTYEPTDAEWSEDSTSVTFSKLKCSSVCPDRQAYLDCLLDDGTISLTLSETTAEAELTAYEGDCTEGTKAVYTATGEVEGHKFTAINKVDIEAGKHSYKADSDDGHFTWTEKVDEEGNPTGEYTATADLVCEKCGDKQENVEAVVVPDDKESVTPTCDDAGIGVFVATATVQVQKDDGKMADIGSATDTKEVVIPALGHKYGEPTWAWKEIKDKEEKGTGEYQATASFTCGNDNNHVQSITVTEGDDNPEGCGIEKSSQDATCETPGTVTYTATVEFNGCPYENSNTVKGVALGHKYGEPTWTWAKDYSNATATFTCQNDKNHVKTVVAEGDAITIVKKPADCLNPDVTTYTAKVSFVEGNKEYAATKDATVIGKPLGHNYSNPTWTWSKDYKTVTATSTCASCGNKVKQNAKVSYAVTTSPTYTAGGAGVYTATCTINGKSYRDTKKIDLPKLSAEAVLDRSSAGVTAGDKISVTLNSKYANDAITSVTLDNKAFATVAFSGKSMTISGVSAGTTKATVKTASNETLTITITVKKPVSVTSFTSAVEKIKKDGNASGSVFGTLSARVSKAGRTSITLKWNKVSGADGYIIYGNKCGTKYKFTKVATVKKTKTTYAKKKLKKGTYYKFIVAAYKKVNGKQVILSTSKTLHAVTSGTKYVNPKSLKVNATRVTLNQGTTYSLKATEVIQKAKKSKKHRRVAFESSNSQVASVSSGGTVTAKRRGSCTIYVYAQNGIYKKVQVTVK